MRRLTQPKIISTSIVQQAISDLRLEVGHVPDAVNGGAKADPSITAITYRVSDFANDGTAKKYSRRSVFHRDWPPEVVEAVRAILDWADTHAEANSLVDPGVRTDAL